MPADLARLTRNWMRQTQLGKGLRLSAEYLDLLNAIGVGELIAAKASEVQRRECQVRIGTTIKPQAESKSLTPAKSRSRPVLPVSRPRPKASGGAMQSLIKRADKSSSAGS
jgi:hypothetical protein